MSHEELDLYGTYTALHTHAQHSCTLTHLTAAHPHDQQVQDMFNYGGLMNIVSDVQTL